jgi:hypothetical protein
MQEETGCSNLITSLLSQKRELLLCPVLLSSCMFALFFQLGTFCPCVLKRNGLFAPIAARFPYSHLKIIPFENKGANTPS